MFICLYVTPSPSGGSEEVLIGMRDAGKIKFLISSALTMYMLALLPFTNAQCFHRHIALAVMHDLNASAVALAVMHDLDASAVIRAIEELKARGYVKGGQQVAIVQSGRQPIWRSASTHAIQVSVFCMHGYLD